MKNLGNNQISYYQHHIKDKLTSGGITMLKFIFIILFVLWLLGMVSSNTMGGFIHILLVLAVGLFLIRIIQGKSPFK